MYVTANRFMLALLCLAFPLLSGCTRGSSGASKVAISFPKSGVGAQSWDPEAFCYAVSVTAADITGRQPSNCDPTIGVVAGSSAAGTTLALEVPKGTARKLAVFAIAKSAANNACPSVTNGFANLSRDKVFAIASQLFDADAESVDLTVTVNEPNGDNTLMAALGLPAICVSGPAVTGSPIATTPAPAYSLSTPSQDTRAKRISGFGNATAVAYGNGFAFVGTDSTGILQIDITVPSNPHAIHSFFPSDMVYKLLVSGNTLFALTSTGLKIVDISSPVTPTLLGFVAAVGHTSMAIGGNFLYTVDLGSGSVTSIDISNLSAPVVKGNLTLPAGSYPFDIAVKGSSLIIANGWNTGKSFAVVSASKPEALAMEYIGDLGVSGLYATGISVSGNYAYVSNANVSLVVVNIASTASPAVANTVYTFDGKNSNSRTLVAGNMLHVLNEGNYAISRLDITAPTSPAGNTAAIYGSQTDCMPCAGSDMAVSAASIMVAARGASPGFYIMPSTLTAPVSGGKTIASASPSSGLSGGETITVSGSGFNAVGKLKYCGADTAFNFLNSASLEFVAPTMGAGSRCNLVYEDPSGVFVQYDMPLVY